MAYRVMLASEEPGGQWEDRSEACGAGHGGGYALSLEGGHLLPCLQSTSRGPIPLGLPDSAGVDFIWQFLLPRAPKSFFTIISKPSRELITLVSLKSWI